MNSTTLTSILLLALASRAARADECRVSVVLAGDGVLVDAIDSTLRQRGIATKATAPCPSTTALVERRDNAIAVTVTDPSGRRSTRTLDDVDAATSLIETWARQDMNASALIGWTEAPPPAPAISETRVDSVALPAASTPRVRAPLTLAVTGEASLSFDGTSWLGARAHACVRIGPLCAGASARIASDASRRSIDVLAGAELPVALAPRIVLVAGVAAGAGSFRSPYSRGEIMTEVTRTGVRLDAHAAIAVAVARHVALHVGLSVGGSPQAPMTISTSGDTSIDNAEPRGFVRADIGLRLGAP